MVVPSAMVSHGDNVDACVGNVTYRAIRDTCTGVCGWHVNTTSSILATLATPAEVLMGTQYNDGSYCGRDSTIRSLTTDQTLSKIVRDRHIRYAGRHIDLTVLCANVFSTASRGCMRA